jgi:hypothetical protein
MPVIHGWYTFNHTTNAVASSTVDCGPNRDALLIKNTDSSITIWFTLSKDVEVAATAACPNSFPLAAGESLQLEGLDYRYITFISASGTPIVKGIAYNRTGD